MSDINLQSITKTFNDTTALNDISLDIKDGEFFVLLGPTGAGKTTTLRVIAGLEAQDEGDVYFDGEIVNDQSPAERDVAFVFQQYSLYPSMTVYENLAFPLKSPLRNYDSAEIDRRVREAADKVRIGHLLDRKTARLSGGEMQRVSIGRAIVRQPRIFLMDEPLSNLDAKLREALRVELEHLQKVQNSTTLFVTHDQIEALTMADRIAVLNKGHILQIGTPYDIYDTPATTFVAQMVGAPKINLLSTEVTDGKLHCHGTALALERPGSKNLPVSFLLGIRPEDIQPQAGAEFIGTVVLTEPLGVETILHIRSGDHTLLSAVAGTSQYRINDTIQFTINRDRLHYFDLSGTRI